MEKKITEIKIQCFHCGEPVYTDNYRTDDHDFCCLGCQSVYSILSSANLRNYYKYNTHPGKTQKEQPDRIDYLDDPTIVQKLIDFQDQEFTLVSFYIPAIHCSSCIWLLENLYKLNSAIVHSRVEFVKKQATLKFRNTEISLRQLIELLTTIGYEPIITLQDVVKKQGSVNQNTLVRKIAVAGFCFGNTMLFSLPEYFGFSGFEKHFSALFAWLNLAFALPVLLYCARDYFVSAITSLKMKQVNLDVPLALGILVLFLRSAIEIVGATGPGFVDTLCGLVFFILIGKYIQNRTFYHLSFERDYRSYFPVAVTVVNEGMESPRPISDLLVGDRVLIRNNEIIPADAILLRGKASVDFSFVTGESDPVEKALGEIVYAGGRQLGEAIELEIVKPVSQSYLTNLWNGDNFKSYDRNFKTFSNGISRYFTLVLLLIASGSAVYWILGGDAEKAWGAFTAVLIIACPCALALSSPFTLSAALSIFDKNKFFIKNTAAIEQMAEIETLVFDKTGTITSPKSEHIHFVGELTSEEERMIAAVCRNSSHPLSIQIVNWLGIDANLPDLAHFEEIPAKGMKAVLDDCTLKIGSAAFTSSVSDGRPGSRVYVSIDGQSRGYFAILQPWRRELKSLITDLDKHYDVHLLSGDRDADREALRNIFDVSKMHFNQAPKDKLEYISKVQKYQNQKVCMIGDGLNDAGALKQADFGVAVSDDINSFSPGCDAILEGAALNKLPRFFAFAKSSMKIIYMCFAISLLYNAVGLFFAVQGSMSPLFAAILMPLSTVTIISFTSIASHVAARKHHLIHY